MRVALDTNILAYAEGQGDSARCQNALDWIQRLSPAHVVLPAQVLGELHRVLVRKGQRSPEQARACVLSWADVFDVADSDWRALQMALDLTVTHRLPIWDALILSVAAEHKCRVLLSEDFQDGFTWSGTTVVNPFNPQASPLMAHLMNA